MGDAIDAAMEQIWDGHEIMTLEDRLEYHFKNKKLLQDAITHPSILKSHDFYEFERLEFLGDRVLGIVVAHWIYSQYPEAREGILAQKHSVLVSREICHEIAKELELENFIQAHYATRKSFNTSILANTVEAILGAMYLDAGLPPCEKFIRKILQKYLSHLPEKDPKSQLQEWVQKQQNTNPVYQLIAKKGPEHSPIFTLEVQVLPDLKARGVGTTRKQAEQDAAKTFIEKYIK